MTDGGEDGRSKQHPAGKVWHAIGFPIRALLHFALATRGEENTNFARPVAIPSPSVAGSQGKQYEARTSADQPRVLSCMYGILPHVSVFMHAI